MRYKITTLKNSSIHHYHLHADSLDEAKQKATHLDGIPPLQIKQDPFIPLPISSSSILTALHQLHLMLLANLPLQDCILSLASHTPNQRLALIFQHIAKSLENGLSLYESFAPYERVFGKLTLVMIEFGSRSGKLCECLKLLLDELTHQEEIKKEIKKALLYPLFVLVCTLFSFVILLWLVVPQFLELFAKNQLSLPIYTKFLIWLYEIISDYGKIIGSSLLIIISFLIWQFQTKGIFYQSLLSIILHTPFLGKILLRSYLHHYFFTLSILSQSGIDLLECISLSQEGIQSKEIQNKLILIQTALINGKTLYDGLKESALFDSLTLSLILIAQKSGKVDDILKTCALNYQKQNQESIAFLISLIEPVFTLLLGSFVLLLALGIFTPIWNLS